MVTKSRIASLLITGAYVTVGYIFRGSLPYYISYVLVPMAWGLACIWFGDRLGEMGGPTLCGAMIRPSPPVLVRFVGWLLLVVLPVLVYLFGKWAENI